MNADDEQTLREIRHFTSMLLDHAESLPAELAEMLREYRSELGKDSPGRWDGIGNPAQHGALAQRIGQSITDGKWPPGARLDCSLDKWYCRGQTLKNAEGALQLLAVRGDLDLSNGTYHVRPRDEGP